MNNFLTFFVIISIGIQGVLAQGQLPKNNSMSSETERQLLWDAYSGMTVDLFTLNAAANTSLSMSDISEYKTDLENFVLDLKERYENHGNTHYLLKTLFYRTHKKYLQRYKPTSNFGNLLATGDYDCLSGTILYSWMLNELGLAYNIVETEHHIYIAINSEEGKFLLESTDPLNGFIYSSEEIDTRLSKLTDEELKDHIFSPIHHAVNHAQLVGLQYFNASVTAYNSGNFIEAVDQIEKASIFYQGDRLKDFGILISKAIVASDMDQQTKMAYLMKLTQTLNKGAVLATLN